MSSGFSTDRPLISASAPHHPTPKEEGGRGLRRINKQRVVITVDLLCRLLYVRGLCYTCEVYVIRVRSIERSYPPSLVDYSELLLKKKKKDISIRMDFPRGEPSFLVSLVPHYGIGS